MLKQNNLFLSIKTFQLHSHFRWWQLLYEIKREWRSRATFLSFFLSCVKEEPFVRSPPLLEAVNPASTHNSLQPRCFHTPRCCRFSAGKSMNPLSTGLLGCWICLDDRLATASGLCRTKKSRGWKFASTDAQTRSRGAGGGNKESISTYLYLAPHPIWNNRICQLLMLCQRFQKSL